MEPLIIEGNEFNPNINFNPETGEFSIVGRSLPENPAEFYEPVINWLLDYIKNPNDITILKIDLDYFNSSTSKYLLTIFKHLEKIYKNKKKVKIQWHLQKNDTEESMENILTYKSLVNLPIEVIEKERNP